jgi:hypothetical protein
VKYAIPTRTLPERPDLDQLKRQAKELLEEFLAGDEKAVAEVNRFYNDADAAKFALHDAQLALARSYGFDSWPKLKAYVDGVTIGRLIDAVRAGDVEQARTILRVRPELVNWEAPSSNGHMPLHYAVLGRMPEMVRVLVQAGANPHTTTAGIYALREAATPIAIAMERGYDEIARIIREEVSRRKAPTEAPPTELRRALESGDEHAVIELLERHSGLLTAPVSDKAGLCCTLHRLRCCRVSRPGCSTTART